MDDDYGLVSKTGDQWNLEGLLISRAREPDGHVCCPWLRCVLGAERRHHACRLYLFVVTVLERQRNRPIGCLDSTPASRLAIVPLDSRLKLLLRLLPSTLDHVSDTLVLLQLLAAGRIGLFWTGLAIDLLPGPAAAAQFKTLGKGAAASAMLLVHPLNG